MTDDLDIEAQLLKTLSEEIRIAIDTEIMNKILNNVEIPRLP